MNLKPNDLLNHDRYCIERVLSDKGGMGIVSLATDHVFGDTVVVKQCRFSSVESLRESKHHRGLSEAELQREVAALQKDFEREAKLLSRLRHNALPRVRDYFQIAAAAQFLVMELIPGLDLEEFLHTARPSLTQVLHWADQLLDALRYLHTDFEKPIIHRDIKPQNLKLMPNGQIVPLDFGLAKGAPSGMSIPHLSVPGGSPAYSPLEQTEEQGTDERSDLYALAVTLHHLLTGQRPPSAATRAMKALGKHPDDPLRPVHELNVQVPPAVSAVLQRAAALNRDERYPTAAAMREALRAAAGTAPMPHVVTPPQPEDETIVKPIAKTDRTGARIEITLNAESNKPASGEAQLKSYVEDLGGGVKLEMVYIPDGMFGDDRRITPFLIGKYQITQAQWVKIMGHNPSYFKGDDLPVESVSWLEAVSFCDHLSKRTRSRYRLPTETEWDYACRAGSAGWRFYREDYFSDERPDDQLGEYAWYHWNSNGRTHPVEQKLPNKFGLHDMYGNVWELCQAPPERLRREPPGKLSKLLEIVVPVPKAFLNLGGGFDSPADSISSSNRRCDSAPDWKLKNVGFRVVCEV